MASPVENRRGILAMLTAMALFAVNDALLKLATASFSAGQVMAARGAIACVLALAIVAGLRKAAALPLVLRRQVLLRAAVESVVGFTFITALAKLPLAIITAILQATPIILTLLTVILRIEPVGWRRWASMIVGFVGVLLIVRPTPEGVDGSVVFALVCATLVAVRDLITRTIPKDVPSTIVTFGTTVGVTLAGLFIVLGEGGVAAWRPIDRDGFILLAGAALVVTLGNIAVVGAFRDTDVSVVSPFRYSVIVWAIVIGYGLFGELPDLMTSLGIVLIVGAGIYTVHRERVRSRREKAIADAPDATRPSV